MHDFILIGQGLAGTFLGLELLRQGASCVFVDDLQPGTASNVAAGIINPITGRRFVKSWRIDQLLPSARTAYRQLESSLSIPLYHEQPILRSLYSVEEENDWSARCLDPAYAAYTRDTHELPLPDGLIRPHGFGLVRGGARVDIAGLITAMRDRWLSTGSLFPERGPLNQLVISKNGVQYKNIRARALIFTEGRWAKENPFFPDLPLTGDKGEVLLVRFPVDFQLPGIVKHRVFLVPLSDGAYWIGSNYRSQYADDKPTEAGRAWLEDNLRRSVSVPFEVLAHKAAIRPTVKDRRPLMGVHPDHDNVFIFNGMGTKGTSLAPFWSAHFASFLCRGTALDPEVDLQRFQSR